MELLRWHASAHMCHLQVLFLVKISVNLRVNRADTPVCYMLHTIIFWFVISIGQRRNSSWSCRFWMFTYVQHWTHFVCPFHTFLLFSPERVWFEFLVTLLFMPSSVWFCWYDSLSYWDNSVLFVTHVKISYVYRSIFLVIVLLLYLHVYWGWTV
jgi:hypothetical protein